MFAGGKHNRLGIFKEGVKRKIGKVWGASVSYSEGEIKAY